MLVIFDNDGVLVNSEALVKESQAQALFEAGFLCMPYERLVSETVGLSWDLIADMIEQEEGSRPALSVRHHAREIYKKKAASSLQPTPGIKDTLQSLKDQGLKYCVASTGSPEKIRFSLTTAGLIDFFEDEHLFSVTMVKRGKPAPDVYLYAATQMGYDPANCVVVEDACAGIAGAQRAHMKALGYAGGDHANNETYRNMLQYAEPDAMLTHMTDLLNHVSASSKVF